MTAQKSAIYHITNSFQIQGGMDFRLENLWPKFLEGLALSQKEVGFYIHFMLLLPQNYHLMVSGPEGILEKIINGLQSFLTHETRPHTIAFPSNFKWTLLFAHNAIFQLKNQLIKHIEHNSFADDGLSYPYSTLYHQMNKINLPFEMAKKDQMMDCIEAKQLGRPQA